MNIAVILAGGTGSRFDDKLPKQFAKIAGKMIIEHTLDVFDRCAAIDEIAIVANTQYLHIFEKILAKNSYKKVKKLLSGGSERYHSSLSALDAYRETADESTSILFHDAVRPLVSDTIINSVVEALKDSNAVDVAISTADTIIEVDQHRFISKIPDRSKLMNGQTPQGFKFSTIRAAYDLALKDKNFKVTDDCGVVKTYLPQEKIFVVEGHESNHKLTRKLDSFILDKLFQLKTTSIADTHMENIKGKVVVLFGGSSGIGKSIGDICKSHGAKVHSFSRANGVDIADLKAVEKALKTVEKAENRIDFVVNTAAVLIKMPLVSLSEQEINQTIATNYHGVVNVSLASFPHLKASKGMLLHFTSSSYTKGRQLYSLYSSTKAAVVNFVQAIAEEWEAFGIRVNCINPERTNTPMRIANFGKEPPETLLTSEDVARKSIYTLLSDISGQIIDVKRPPAQGGDLI